MEILDRTMMCQIKGREVIALTGILLYVGAAAAIVAIVKIATSGKGRVKLPGISLEWTSN